MFGVHYAHVLNMFDQKKMHHNAPLDLLMQSIAQGNQKAFQHCLAGYPWSPKELNGICPSAHALWERPVLLAAAQGRTRMLQSLLEHGASLDVRSACGDPPLHVACANNQMSTVSYLLTHHPECVKKTNESQENALFAALSSASVDPLILLLQQGMNPESRDRFGNTLVLRALECSEESVPVLLLFGADPKACNFFQQGVSSENLRSLLSMQSKILAYRHQKTSEDDQRTQKETATKKPISSSFSQDTSTFPTQSASVSWCQRWLRRRCDQIERAPERTHKKSVVF